MNQEKKFKRKQFIVLKEFQLRYILILLAIMFFTGLLCAYTVYYSGMMLLGEKLANVYPQGRLVAVINTVNLRILLSLLLVAPLVIVIAIFLSHKIAGPVYRLDRSLREIADGDLSLFVKFRKGDELSHLSVAVNRLVEILRNNLTKEKKLSDTISGHVKVLKQLSERPSIDKNTLSSELDGLSGDAERLKELYTYYKLQKESKPA